MKSICVHYKKLAKRVFSAVLSWPPFLPGAAILFLLLSNSLFAETETDSALWAGGLFLFEKEKGLDYSEEYQLRLGDHMSSLSLHIAPKRTECWIFVHKYKALQEYFLISRGYTLSYPD